MDDQLEWTTFERGDEPTVLTADLCTFFGGCEKCPGFTKVGIVRPDHAEPDATVFCAHWCHRVAHDA